ncbi:MAG: PqqD family protein [Bacteroidetes bacterium]|jgi:hypothetical protein|nr:PqqD family protein [Bacteroidota bacterium]MBT3750771.1 PqqD family protein [Bacteroidota bacterium]MBT4398956.1 PqqD family protein [Bacteroidota bacterium]MBT4409613.1 PqqD family protein [Bacteroidota bacterium]MBT5427730.1 PqqD family protein [Bacteroidota bacterium]
MNNLEKSFKPKSKTLIFPFEEKHLIIPVPDNLANFQEVYAVNESGLELWMHLCDGKTPADIFREWNQQYAIPEIELLNSILIFLRNLSTLLDVNE